MHHLIGVILPFQYAGDKLNEAITEILKPWDQNNETGDGEWDWWQLGGRWTGIWSDYDPRTDPANHEQCWLCHGTGLRNDHAGQQQRAKDPSYTCNRCGYDQGPRPGIALKWATQWVKRPEADLIPVPQLLDLVAQDDGQLPYALVAAPDTWIARSTWIGSDFVDTPNWPAVAQHKLAGWRDCWIAAVDIHS